MRKLLLKGVMFFLVSLLLASCSTDQEILTEPTDLKLLTNCINNIYVSDKIPQAKINHLGYIIGLLNTLPEEVKTTIVNLNKIIIVPDLNEVSNKSIVEFNNGKYSYEDKDIYVSPSNGNEYTLYGTLLHEIGHAYDKDNMSRKIISNDNQFINIANEEYAKLFNNINYPGATEAFFDHHKTTDEYFAECFRNYFDNQHYSELLKESAPKTYDFIESLFEVNSASELEFCKQKIR
ncbi:hypothetical protein GC101_25390 [Paenibacillus sp. LMG 31459]|uniref:ATLF-like domain-containing protein n=1 Tax=Paenibacillus phytohabitans TaxID=2654978 RepID=A0ABX1YRK0_9BACL|nr:hypothetical protein [Paenibacillus phytohabitans]NOU82204.1 hypothetical protein [Paenibacillus phytohabitans]